MKHVTAAFALLAACLLAGCGSPQPTAAPLPAPNPGGVLQPQGPSIQVPPAATSVVLPGSDSAVPAPAATLPPADPFISRAKQDLAERLKIDTGQIALVKVADLTWPDPSLGCSPGAGQVLTQGSAAGYQIWLEAESQEYIYHATLAGQLLLCPSVNLGADNPLLNRTPALSPPPPATNP